MKSRSAGNLVKLDVTSLNVSIFEVAAEVRHAKLQLLIDFLGLQMVDRAEVTFQRPDLFPSEQPEDSLEDFSLDDWERTETVFEHVLKSLGDQHELESLEDEDAATSRSI